MTTWATEWDQHASKLCDEGWSAGQIAEDLNIKFRINKTRNAVIGRLYRLGKPLHGRESAQSRNRRAQAARHSMRGTRSPPKQAPKRELGKQAKILKAIFSQAEPLPPPRETDIARIHLCQTDLSPTDRDYNPITICGADGNIYTVKKHCRWIVGDPAEGMCCGDERVEGLPYCKPHAARAYNPPTVHQPRPHNTGNRTPGWQPTYTSIERLEDLKIA